MFKHREFLKSLFLVFFLFPSFALAEVKEITAEGTYNMGNGETPLVAESRARVNAERNAIEQAGVYIESYSKVKDFQLTHDEIQILASGVMEEYFLDKKRTVIGDGIQFWVKIKARVSTDKMEEMAKRVKEKSVLEDYKKIQEAYERSQKEIQALKKELAATKTAQGKKVIENKIAADEKLFQANERFNKGHNYDLNKDFDPAIRAYSSAISINSNFVEAYSSRGAVYGLKGQYDRAIEDFNKAIAIDPNFALAYYNRGNVYYNQGQYSQAIEDFNKAIAINPNYVDAYYNRGTAYSKINAYDHALADIRTAARLGDKKAQVFLEDLEKKEISTTPVRNVKSLPPAPPSAIATEREVRQFFESYVKRYNLKDLEGIISSFSAKAIQNQRDDLGRIRKSYETFFGQMDAIQYRITIDKIDPEQNSIEVRGQYELEGVLIKGRKKQNWKGQVRWVLVREAEVLKILILDYKPQSSK